MVERVLPGHIKKAFHSIERFLPVVDLLIELVDARLPVSSRLEGFTKRLGKEVLLVLGKADLADPACTREWLEHFRREGMECLALNAREPSSVKALAAHVRKLAETHGRVGARTAAQPVRRLLVIGIPNVGKSTLINALAGRRAARVANLPGVTRNIQWIKLSGLLELLDLPGILDYRLLKRGDILRLINTVPGPDEDPQAAAETLFRLLPSSADCPVPLEGWQPGRGFRDFLADFSQQRHFLMRGGHPDVRRGAADLVKRFQDGLLGGWTLETPTRPLPEDLPA